MKNIIIIGGHEETTLALTIMRRMESQGMSCSILTPEELEQTGLKPDVVLDNTNQPQNGDYFPDPIMFEMVERYELKDIKYYEPTSVNPMDNKRGGKKNNGNKFGR